MNKENYWKVREGYSRIPESKMNREESGRLWNGAVDSRYIIEPNLPWPANSGMQADLFYSLNPEHKGWKPDPSKIPPPIEKPERPHVIHNANQGQFLFTTYKNGRKRI